MVVECVHGFLHVCAWVCVPEHVCVPVRVSACLGLSVHACDVWGSLGVSGPIWACSYVHGLVSEHLCMSVHVLVFH